MAYTLGLAIFFYSFINLIAKPVITGNGSISYHNIDKEIFPPETIYRTDDLTEPVPTNDWWSSILWEKFSSNHFPHPLALDYDKQGLRIFYPGNSINAFDKGLAAVKSGDFETALREWTPLAEQGHIFAQFNVGLMYDKGDGVPQDYKTAAKWYTLAAEQGHIFSQLNLGLMYLKGQGVLQDYKTAVKWFNLY